MALQAGLDGSETVQASCEQKLLGYAMMHVKEQQKVNACEGFAMALHGPNIVPKLFHFDTNNANA